jgi:hypothetical protein
VLGIFLLGGLYVSRNVLICTDYVC